MTRKFSRLLVLPIVAAAFAFSLVSMANAQSYFRTAQSGQSKKMDAYYGWNNDCSHKLIDVQVVEPPKNGRVSPKIVYERIRNNAAIGSSGNCAGKRTKAVAVYYRSKGGYRGTDRFRVRMSVGGQSKFFTYTVRVN